MGNFFSTVIRKFIFLTILRWSSSCAVYSFQCSISQPNESLLSDNIPKICWSQLILSTWQEGGSTFTQQVESQQGNSSFTLMRHPATCLRSSSGQKLELKWNANFDFFPQIHEHILKYTFKPPQKQNSTFVNFFFLCPLFTNCLLFFTLSEPQSHKAVLMDNNSSKKIP